MTCRSPFGDINTSEHNGEDALCLSRTHCANAVEDTLLEFHQAALAAIDSQAPQPAFFLARQLTELTLKALHLPHFPAGHNLTVLLESLHHRGDDLLAGGAEQALVVAFIRDLDHHDRAATRGGTRPPAPATRL